MQENNKKNILVVPVDTLTDIVHLLDYFCTEQFNVGKKTEKYWIIRTSAGVQFDGRPETEKFNRLMQESLMRGFTEVMITF